jgi:hypothetical protein
MLKGVSAVDMFCNGLAKAAPEAHSVATGVAGQ